MSKLDLDSTPTTTTTLPPFYCLPARAVQFWNVIPPDALPQFVPYSIVYPCVLDNPLNFAAQGNQVGASTEGGAARTIMALTTSTLNLVASLLSLTARRQAHTKDPGSRSEPNSTGTTVYLITYCRQEEQRGGEMYSSGGRRLLASTDSTETSTVAVRFDHR